MKQYQKKNERYCVDCKCNLANKVYLELTKKCKLLLFQTSYWSSFDTGNRCKICSENYKQRIHFKKRGMR